MYSRTVHQGFRSTWTNTCKQYAQKNVEGEVDFSIVVLSSYCGADMSVSNQSQAEKDSTDIFV